MLLQLSDVVRLKGDCSSARSNLLLCAFVVLVFPGARPSDSLIRYNCCSWSQARSEQLSNAINEVQVFIHIYDEDPWSCPQYECCCIPWIQKFQYLINAGKRSWLQQLICRNMVVEHGGPLENVTMTSIEIPCSPLWDEPSKLIIVSHCQNGIALCCKILALLRLPSLSTREKASPNYTRRITG